MGVLRVLVAYSIESYDGQKNVEPRRIINLDDQRLHGRRSSDKALQLQFHDWLGLATAPNTGMGGQKYLRAPHALILTVPSLPQIDNYIILYGINFQPQSWLLTTSLRLPLSTLRSRYTPLPMAAPSRIPKLFKDSARMALFSSRTSI
jgi:hypothetical protein